MAKSAAALVDYLRKNYPDVHFAYGKRFKYRYPGRVTLENPENWDFSGENAENSENPGGPLAFFALQTLHELGHALCKHKDYNTDVSRLKIESEAWERAKTAYDELPEELRDFEWDEDFVEESLDTYRDWLHQKSTCRNCGLTCYQTEDGVYHCPRCENFTPVTGRKKHKRY